MGSTQQRPRGDRWKEVGRARWEGRGDGRSGVWGDPLPAAGAPPPGWALVGSMGGAWTLAGASPGCVGRGQQGAAWPCAGGRPAGPRHAAASLVHVPRPVGKAGCGAAGCGQPGLPASGFEWGCSRGGGAAHLASGARPTAPACAKLTRRGKGLPVRGGRSQGPQRPVDVGSRYAGHENGVEVEGAVMGLPSLPAAPLSSFPPSAHPSLEDYI